MTGGNSASGSALKLENPLRISRIVDQTPGTVEELYSEQRPARRPREDGDSRPPQRGGRGAPRPVASAGGGISKYCTVLYTTT
jgi:hypothetical protein